LGYLIAAARVAHWLEELEASWGLRWWAAGTTGAGDSIRGRIRQGGTMRFDARWLTPDVFARRWLLPAC
jgi:hypothetical protein